MVTHSSILAWRTPMDRGAWWAAVFGSHSVRHNWSDLACTHAQLYERPSFDMQSPSQSDLFIFAPSSVTATWLLNIPRRNVFLMVLAFVHHPFFLYFSPTSNHHATLHPPTHPVKTLFPPAAFPDSFMGICGVSFFAHSYCVGLKHFLLCTGLSQLLSPT